MNKTHRNTRPRALQACEVCRARKNRCSEDRPCTYCIEHDLECTYSRTARDKRPRFIQQAPTGRGHRDRRSKAFQSTTQDDHDGEGFVQAPNLSEATLQAQRFHASTSDEMLRETGVSTPVRGSMQGDARDLDSTSPERVGQRDFTSIGSISDDSNVLIPSSALTHPDSASEVIDTNTHTGNLEFYGGSSSVAFLQRVETISNTEVQEPTETQSIASLLHNSEFQPDSIHNSPMSEKISQVDSSRFYFRVARRFIEAYFSNIHHIQPLFDEEQFRARAENLWFNKPEQPRRSFVALYYATSSLGSLVMVWEDREILGADRFAWSRKLFNDALGLVRQLGSATDVEMAQCYYMLAKVCQYELNPHVAYLYSGQAARTALAIGINRRPVDGKQSDPRASLSASMTWWAIYCLEIQTGFALGRPDCLGPDEYHTQYMPGLPRSTDPDTSRLGRILQITPFMVKISKIMRKASLKLYTGPCTIEERVRRAKSLDVDLEHWHKSLPVHLRAADKSSLESSPKPKHPASFASKQSVILKLCYHNLRMVIHGVFMTLSEPIDPSIEGDVQECRRRCIESACRTIDLIYNVFAKDNYFQSWWYNVTYTLFAVSIALTSIFQRYSDTVEAVEDLFTHIDRAIAVLQIMDECIVARNASSIIKRALCRAKKVPLPGSDDAQQSSDIRQQADIATNLWDTTDVDRSGNTEMLPPSSTVGAIENNTVDDLNLLNGFPLDDTQQSLFWTEWAHELDVLGT